MTDLTPEQQEWLLEAEKNDALTPAQQQWLAQAREVGAMPEASMSFGEAYVEGWKNLPSSALQFGKDVIQPILHPIDTAESLYELSKGLVQLIIPGEQGSEDSARAVGEYLKQRYGGWEEIKRTMAKDPMGLQADVATIFTGGAAAAAKVPMTAGKVAKTLNTAAKFADPLTAAQKAISGASKAAKPLIPAVIGNLGTHTGSDSIRAAYNAGKGGGKASQTFLDNMRGNVPIESVLADAKMALERMRQQRATKYKAGMAGVAADTTVLDFSKIDRAISNVSDVGNFKGVDTNPAAAKARQAVRDVIEEWRQLDPVEYHTPEGFDALKQKIGSVADDFEYGSRGRKVVDQAYNAVRDEIVNQAPDYAKVMKDYEEASSTLKEIETTLSLNKKASVDTQLRKLQSVMRNNVNTNYGQRAGLVDTLDATGANITPAIAGQALNSPTPRGLGNVTMGASALTGLTSSPWAFAALPFQSPRLMGEASYAAGTGARGIQNATNALPGWVPKMTPDKVRATALPTYQVGRAPTEEEARVMGLLP